MSEYQSTATHVSAEAVHPQYEDELAPGRQVYKMYQALVSPEGVAARKQWLEAHLAGEDDISLKHVDNLQKAASRKQDASIEASSKGDFAAARHHAETRKQLKATVEKVYGASAVSEHYNTVMALHQLEQGTGQRYWGGDALRMRDALLEAVQPIDTHIDETPPAQRADVQLDDYKTYLNKRLFIESSVLSDAADASTDLITLELSPEENFEVPLANVVYASGFIDSWADERMKSPEEPNSVTKQSIAVVKDYAERETALPPAEGVMAYIQPNGIILFGVNGSNHRTAAAIARGDETLKIDGNMQIKILERNILNETALAHEMQEPQLAAAA